MQEIKSLLPDGYGPLAAPEVGCGGYWTSPLAAGIETRGDMTYLVVLHHRSFEPAFIREIPRSDVAEQVDVYLAEAVQALANFDRLLSCAVDPYLYPKLAKFDGPCYTSPWLWVRYPHSATSDAYGKNEYLTKAWDKPYYHALALATKLQEDLNLLQDFDREFRHLITLGEAMQRLQRILMTKLPEDMARVVRIHHDLSF